MFQIMLAFPLQVLHHNPDCSSFHRYPRRVSQPRLLARDDFTIRKMFEGSVRDANNVLRSR